MKKFFAIAFIAATLVACNGGGEATPAADTTAAPVDTAAAVVDTAAAAAADTTAAAPAAETK
jgi:PBP1b-binding outer membrane lipoprotein LpoB